MRETRSSTASRSSRRPSLPRSFTRSARTSRLPGANVATSFKRSSASSQSPADISSCESSNCSSRRSAPAPRAACSARPESAAFHLLSSRARLRILIRLALVRRSSSSGSSRFGLLPVACCTAAALFSTSTTFVHTSSLRPRTTSRLGAWLQAPRQPTASTVQLPMPLASSSISSSTASEPALRQAPAWHTRISAGRLVAT
mmetsp:Transcript_48081/g.153452  ORF Transcript_48081/g.153452 Transcript_48081/m.153452 type:complete len:201 (-) Transcript_48081:202-804(-)